LTRFDEAYQRLAPNVFYHSVAGAAPSAKETPDMIGYIPDTKDLKAFQFWTSNPLFSGFGPGRLVRFPYSGLQIKKALTIFS
jgi:hypothetical protein